MTRKITDIQALRAFAILFVFLQHIRATIPSGALGGLPDKMAWWIGVELFLVISGFVITRSIISKASEKPWAWEDFRTFWQKRFLRLLPASVFWLIVGVGVSFLILDGRALVLNLWGSLVALSGTYNIYNAYCLTTNSFGAVCPKNAITHIYWSLSLEEQFYLFLSVCMFLKRPRLVILGAFVLVVGLFWVEKYTSSAVVDMMNRIAMRSFGLFYGVALACSLDLYRPHLSKIPKTLRALAILFLTASIPLVPNYFGGIGILIVGVMCAAVVAVATPDNALGNGKIGNVLVWVGERSYSIYLCHFSILYIVGWLIYSITGTAAPKHDSVMLSLIAIVLSMWFSALAAHFSYEQIEKRFMRA